MSDIQKLLSMVIGTAVFAIAAGVGLASCTHATEEVDEIGKSRAAHLMNSGNADTDYCKTNGWYGDGNCDTFCEDPDPDCGGEAGDKKDDGSGEGAGEYDPCADKACGAECQTCPPGDTDCAETAAVKYCQPDGSCSSSKPTCNGNGGGHEPPSSYDPCADKSCGTTCTTCPPGDSDCAETAVVKYCQPDGSCGMTQPDCDNDGGDHEPPESYDPCENKTCGETCTRCPPGDNDCAETDVVKYCQPDGSCHMNQPSCQ